MILENNTILITGGGSGIGFELARVLLEKSNQVIICGRSLERLLQAQQKLPGVIVYQCDISKSKERKELQEWISRNHPECNVLINNAAIVSKTNFHTDEDMIEKAQLEIDTNLMAPIALCKLFLPVLETNKRPTIINVTTGLIYAPRVVYPIYNATKAGLHAFTQVLRQQLKSSDVKVMEVMMPAVKTPWHQGLPPKIAISPEKAVSEAVKKIEAGQLEIKVGGVSLLYWLSRISPSFAFKKINQL